MYPNTKMYNRGLDDGGSGDPYNAHLVAVATSEALLEQLNTVSLKSEPSVFIHLFDYTGLIVPESLGLG